MIDKKVAIIGCGNLGTSILKGLMDEPNLPNKNIIATKRNVAQIVHFETEGIKVTSDNVEAIKASEIIVFALKPYNTLETIEALKSHINPEKHILISVATGILMKDINATINLEMPIFRAMPNTAADVKESLTCLCSENATDAQNDLVKKMFDLIGESIFISEKLMDAATVLGACGIAYVLRFMRAMVQGGIQIGFDAKTATEIVNQTVKGASELLIQRKQHPEFEIDKVTTPKGCTIAGLNEMEHNGFSSSLIKGINESYNEII